MNDYNELIERCKEICDFLQTGLQRINNHRYSVAALCSATEDVLSYVVTDVFACNGGKCRELLCESCFSSAKESAVKASEAYTRALNALERVKATLDAGGEAANQAGCKGENCGIMPGGNHSPECILEAAETQGWLDAPESVRAAKESLRNIGVETCSRAAGVIELLQSRVAELESRLEISPLHNVDGIMARDATIKLQDERIAELEAERAERERQEPIATVGWDRNFMGVVWHGKDMPEKGVETLLYAAPPVTEQGCVTVTTDESGRAVAVTRQDDDHRILSVIWEAPPVAAPVRLTDRDKDGLAVPYSGMGGIEDYRAYAQDVESAALRANGFKVEE